MSSIYSIYRFYRRGGNTRIASALRALHVYRHGF